MDDTRAATNDYFDNRLVGRLFFSINLIKYNYFIDKKHTIPHSAQCPSNKLNAMKRSLSMIFIINDNQFYRLVVAALDDTTQILSRYE